jgi:spermidine synthase
LSEPPRRILVLGIGAGTALLQYRRFIDPDVLVGVDLDPLHIEIGRRFFGLDEAGAQLFEADARHWVADWSGPPFDLVVDDLYGHEDGEPQRGVPMNAAWAAALARLVSPGGTLVANFISGRELQGCAQLRASRSRASYASGFRLWGPRDHNAVGVFCRRATSAAATRERVRRVPGLDDRHRRCALSYTMRKLW